MKSLPLHKLPSPLEHPLIDTHIHLDSEEYHEDWKIACQRAQTAGIECMVIPATDLPSSHRVAAICAESSFLHPCIGIHPHSAESFDPDTSPKELNRLLPGAKAIGESGLEAFYDFCPWEKQQTCLRHHLRLAKEVELPLILHCRDAELALYEEMLPLAPFPAGGVIHCYTGSSDLAEKFVELGFHLGVTGLISFAPQTLLETLRRIPLDRILLETDGPYLAPKPFRGCRNESALIPLIAQRLAEVREITPSEIAFTTTRNAKRLFGID